MATLFRGRVITCRVCGEMKRVARSDATMCSSKCRMRFKRKCDAITQGTAVVPDAKRAAAGSLPPVTPAVAVTPGRADVTDKRPKAWKHDFTATAAANRAREVAAKKVSHERAARNKDKGKRLSAAKAAKKKGRAQ